MPAQPPPLPTAIGEKRPQYTVPAVDLRLLADLPSLALRARYLVEGWLNGQHRSPLKGHSIEFVEYRAYQPGDELRHLDWRFYGRSDRLCIKRYEEETQLRVTLLLDVSRSMLYRSRPGLMTKLDHARVALAGMAVLAQQQSDAVGVGFLADELADYLPPRSSRAHLHDLFGRLDHPPATLRCNLAPSVNHLAELLRHRSLVVIASDFYEDSAELGEALRRLRYDGHETIGLHVLDPVEIDFDQDQAGVFVDTESRASLPVMPGAVRAAYLARFREFQAEVTDLFRSSGGDFVTLRTDEPPLAALGAYLSQRENLL